MRLLHFPVEPFYENTFVLIPAQTDQGAVIVDPGSDGSLLMEVLQGNRVPVVTVILTHAHIDHVSGLPALKAAFGDLKVMMHPADQNLYTHLDTQARLFSQPVPDVPPVDHFLEHSEVITHDDIHMKVLHTPGHSKGSICVLISGERDILLSGDTLFREGIGRTDVLGGSRKQILHSIKQHLMALDDTTLVLPGHGGDTTIGHERLHNPFLKGL